MLLCLGIKSSSAVMDLRGTRLWWFLHSKLWFNFVALWDGLPLCVYVVCVCMELHMHVHVWWAECGGLASSTVLLFEARFLTGLELTK